MIDICFTTDQKVRFQKLVWHETEIMLAECFSFTLEQDAKGFTGVIIADPMVTTQQSMREFIRLSFKSFSESITEIDRREKFFTRLSELYNYLQQGCLGAAAEKLPYFNKMYAHQHEGLFLSYFKQFNFLAYEMRLGKSITSASISRVHGLARTVIVCPANAKWGWFRDLTRNWGFNEMYFTILDSSKSRTIIAFNERFVIVNYDVLGKFKEFIIKGGVDHFIFDECHRLKNHLSQRFKISHEIVKQFPKARITLLSGTPIPNRFNDLFSYFVLTGHKLGNSYKKFVDEYTTKIASRGGERVNGARNIDDLKLKMSNFMQRKRMDECFDMPKDIPYSYVFKLDDYRDEYNKIIEELSQQKDIKSLTGNIHSLNIITCKAKMKGIIEAIEDILSELRESESPVKIVVFGSYKEPLQMLEKHFGKRCVKIDGSVPSFDRDRLRNEFTNNVEIEVLLGNYIAAGEAMELSIASDWMCINFPLTPKEFNQAKFRIKHPEKPKPNRYHHTMCEESIDEYIYDIIIDKEKDINALIDGGKDVLERSNITELLIEKLLGKKAEVTEISNEPVFKEIGTKAVDTSPNLHQAKTALEQMHEIVGIPADRIGSNTDTGTESLILTKRSYEPPKFL